MTMTTFRESALKLHEKLRKSERYLPISDEEYQALKVQQFCKLDQIAQENFKPDLSRLGLHESELSLDWDDIKPGFSDGTLARDAVRPKFAQGWGMVFLWGSYGQAKTLCGKILIATAHRQGMHATYANMAYVLDDIRRAFDSEYKSVELARRMDFWINRDVLFIDELDKVNGTSWAEERLFQLLDQRYTRATREEALTVIASNKSTDALDGYLKSRLADRRLGPVVYLNGADGRQSVPDQWKF